MTRKQVGIFVIAPFLITFPGCKKAPPPKQAAPVPVIAAEVIVRDQPVYVENIGQTLGGQDVDIRARVEGFLDAVHFKEGNLVNSNDLLYTIDDKPFVAAWRQAQAAVSQAVAELAKARQDTNRFGPLWQARAISRQQYDDAVASEAVCRSRLEAAQAQLESAKIQLDYTRIYAPIDGIIGKTEVKPGNLVGRGASTLLTTLSSIDPIHVRFSVNENDYLQWRRHYSEPTNATATQDVFELVLSDGTLLPRKGHLVFADRQVDAATGTLLLEVAFPNPKPGVRPGQFGRVRVITRTIPQAVLVPQRAISELQANFSVFVVSPESKAEFRRIQLGPRIGAWWVVDSGLKPGEKVVVEGVQKLQNNVPINPTFTNLVALANATR